MYNSIFSENGKLNLSAAKKFHSASSGGAITIIRTNGSGDRTRPSKSLLTDLGNPSWVDVYLTEEQVIIVPSMENSADNFKIGKGDVLYNTQLAKEIMQIAGIEFPENKSTSCGTYTIETVDDTTKAAVVSFGNTTHAVDTADNGGEEE